MFIKTRIPILLLLISIVVTSCFRTREVEPPQTSNSDWVSPTAYPILLNNLQKSVNDGNAQNYLRCFRQDSFRFVPSTPVYPQNQLLWDNWSLQDERVWFENVQSALGLAQGNYLKLQETDLQNFSNDSLRYIGDYELRMNHTDTALTVVFKGQVELRMRLNQYNEWAIERWEDFETHPDSSWSRLKLSYVQ